MPRTLTHRQRAFLIGGVIVVCLTLAVIMLVTAPRVTHLDVDRGHYPVKGIDVSSYNGRINWPKVAQDTVTFAYIRSTMGVDGRDKRWRENYHNARLAGMRIGAYHYFRHQEDGEAQARNLLSAIKGRHLDMPLAIDIEDPDSGPPRNIDTIVRQLHRMMAYLHARGYRIVLYTNKKGWRRYLQGRVAPAPYELWLCSFNTSVGGVHDQPVLWQHSHQGSVRGISGDVDLDTFNGSVADFVLWARGPLR